MDIEAERLKKKYKEAYKKFIEYQDNCKHPNAFKINKSDTGNWDPYDDAYWKECSCPNCGKQWNENQ